MKKLKSFKMWMFGLLLCFAGSAALAYEIAPVENGGVITGKVVLNGPVPEPRVFPMVLYAFGDFCKKISDAKGHVVLKEFNVDPAGGLQDAVIAIQDVSRGKPFRSNENRLFAVNCMFHPANVPEDEQFELDKDGNLVHIHPLVSVMRNKHMLAVLNRDPVIHDAQFYQKETGHRITRFPIPISDKVQKGWVYLDQGKKIAQIICGMHEYMQTWAWIVDNPYFDKTSRDGTFIIDRIPPGTYKILAWHPHLKPIEKIVTVPADGLVELNFEFDAREVVRPIYETQKQFRISPERDPHVNLFGCEGPFCVKREHDHHVD
jgi:hypothetical protein